MGYQDFVDSKDYDSRVAGASIAVLVYEEGDLSKPVIAGTTGINAGDDFEGIPIEESGNEGVDEIVQGRHTGQASMQAFWSAARNDRLPTRQDFIGKRYIILEVMAEDRPGAGQVQNAYTGVRITHLGHAHGARGPKTVDMTYMFEHRYTGLQWATLNGLM